MSAEGPGWGGGVRGEARGPQAELWAEGQVQLQRPETEAGGSDSFQLREEQRVHQPEPQMSEDEHVPEGAEGRQGGGETHHPKVRQDRCVGQVTVN